MSEQIDPAPEVPLGTTPPDHEALDVQVDRVVSRRLSRNVAEVEIERALPGGVAADWLADQAGSWRFILLFAAFLCVWILLNVAAWVHHWDPYPFILLNLMLSCLAAIQAPVIMMSQKRQELRDRFRAQNDFEVNVKAEILLEHLTIEVQELKGLLADLGVDEGGAHA